MILYVHIVFYLSHQLFQLQVYFEMINCRYLYLLVLENIQFLYRGMCASRLRVPVNPFSVPFAHACNSFHPILLLDTDALRRAIHLGKGPICLHGKCDARQCLCMLGDNEHDGVDAGNISVDVGQHGRGEPQPHKFFPVSP